MIKKIILFILAIAAVYGAALSPYNLSNTLEIKSRLEAAVASSTQAEATARSAKKSLTDAMQAFESQRTFDIHYSDLAKIKQLLDSVSGVSFSGLAEVDPNNNYALGANINPEDYANGATPPKAVRLSLVAEDTAAGLRIVNRLELPVVSILATEPGRIEVTFLTGGDS